MTKTQTNNSLERLLKLLVKRGEAEYNHGLSPIPENQKNYENAQNQFDESIADLGFKDIQTLEFYEWLKDKGFIIWCGESKYPRYPGTNYLLGKIQQSGERKTPKGKKYKWYIVETKTEDFKGLETVENYDYFNKIIHIPWVYIQNDIIGDRTMLKKEFEEYLWFFDEDIETYAEERLKPIFKVYMDYRFLLPHFEKAQEALDNPRSHCFGDEKKAKDFFISLCTQEALELFLFYEYPIILDGGENPQSIKKAYLYQLANHPSFFTLANLANIRIPDLKAIADEIFKMFEKKGYSQKRISEANLEEIQKIAFDLFKLITI